MTEFKINTEDLTRPDYKPTLEVPIFKILGEDADSLRRYLEPFDFENPPVNPNAFASSLVETCKQSKGIGLSANQCGFDHRVFVMGAGNEYVAFFNPVITAVSRNMEHMMEGCLSFPFLGLRISRPAAIKVKYQDFNGEFHEAEYDGLSARTFLHEYDHLNGIVYIQRVKPLALQSGIKKRAKLIKSLTQNVIMKSESNGNSKRRNRKTMASVAG